MFFQLFVVPDVQKSRLAKAAGAEVVVQRRNEKWHAAGTFKMRKTPQARSQNAQKHHMCGPLLKLRCRKIARRCGAKRICKSKCTKRLCFGTLFEVQMSKN